MRAVLLLILIFAFRLSVAADSLNIPLDLSVDRGDRDSASGRTPVLVTLQNAKSEAVTDLVLQLRRYETLCYEWRIGAMGPGVTWVGRIYVPDSPGGYYLLARYKGGSGLSSVARSVPGVLKPHQQSNSAALPAISSLLGVVVGAWLIHSFSARREHNRANFEWKRMMFEKYEGVYRRFLRNWNGSRSVVVLRREFEELTAGALVSREIQSAYESALRILQSSGVSEDEMNSACDLLYSAVERFLVEAPGYR